MTDGKDAPQAKRLNQGKVELGYVLQNPQSIKCYAYVMQYGAAKYTKGNWKLGHKPDDEYIDAFMRHWVAWVNGERYDPESGCNHLGHCLFNLMCLIDLNHPNELVCKDVYEAALNRFTEATDEGVHRRPDERLSEVEFRGV